ncbi:hypothetical protein FEM48_Zijuj02G0201000 [Ziziphus jujuba var. spinosa]|uniref:Lipoxygenase domain-containing protein n=1 Tax=Ziziphus jujuba var. spinosa TaxID=714518 RepID=A0A978VXQ5_ZIZJJ|nr:hypothetical protein FEM48_Zijuj02G0201000 [Ziziphus jujuba var. spinosa]
MGDLQVCIVPNRNGVIFGEDRLCPLPSSPSSPSLPTSNPDFGFISAEAWMGKKTYSMILNIPIDSLFSEGVDLPPIGNEGFLRTILPRVVKAIADTGGDVLRFETPEAFNRDKFFWFSDEEFARQTLAGLNPYSIRLIRAMKKKKLFILDYHDLLLPFVKRVRLIKGTTLYGSRTIFFLNPDGTLRPLAIELTRPPMDDKPQWKQVFTSCSWHSSGVWLWRIAKIHVLAHDSGYHQLVSHWLRTHCVTEPYVIATNRQLSVMHPIYRLLDPHLRYTMEINALAREALINAEGTIETCFAPGSTPESLALLLMSLNGASTCKHCLLTLLAGMAVEDPDAPHGLKLTIEDYPFANDGLLLWDAIKEWVSNYVNHYYPGPSQVESDEELQAWWTEIRTKGHEHKKDEPWWPVLKTSKDLIEIITAIVWVTSGHHAAVTFGQYTYAGYFPNRPTIARTNMPTEDPSEEDWKRFMKKPETALFQCFPSKLQAIRVMAVLDILSNHSPDEGYLGKTMEQSWADDPIIKAAFERFNERLKMIEGIIDENSRTEMELEPCLMSF